MKSPPPVPYSTSAHHGRPPSFEFQPPDTQPPDTLWGLHTNKIGAEALPAHSLPGHLPGLRMARALRRGLFTVALLGQRQRAGLGRAWLFSVGGFPVSPSGPLGVHHWPRQERPPGPGFKASRAMLEGVAYRPPRAGCAGGQVVRANTYLGKERRARCPWGRFGFRGIGLF